MLCRGYKLSGYDATYRKATFGIAEKKEGVLEITDTESGTTFILDLNDLAESSKQKPRGWKSQRVTGQGVSITFGSKGLYQKLMYAGKKRKTRTNGGKQNDEKE